MPYDLGAGCIENEREVGSMKATLPRKLKGIVNHRAETGVVIEGIDEEVSRKVAVLS